MRLTQNERIEAALPPRLMLNVAVGGLTPDTEEERKTVETIQTLLVRATMEPLQGFNAATRAFVWKKIENAAEEAARLFMLRDPAKDGMIVYYLLEDHILKLDRIALLEGSSFAEAMGIAMPYLNEAFAEADLDRSAQKKARQLFEYFQAKGLYS